MVRVGGNRGMLGHVQVTLSRAHDTLYMLPTDGVVHLFPSEKTSALNAVALKSVNLHRVAPFFHH
jgi:hypothetical protein